MSNRILRLKISKIQFWVLFNMSSFPPTCISSSHNSTITVLQTHSCTALFLYVNLFYFLEHSINRALDTLTLCWWHLGEGCDAAWLRKSTCRRVKQLGRLSIPVYMGWKFKLILFESKKLGNSSWHQSHFSCSNFLPPVYSFENQLWFKLYSYQHFHDILSGIITSYMCFYSIICSLSCTKY